MSSTSSHRMCIPAKAQTFASLLSEYSRRYFQSNEKEIIIKSRDYAQVSRRRRSFSSVGSIIQSGIQAAIPAVNGQHS